MCLAVPARIIELKGDDAIADCIGNRIETKTTLVPDVKVGDIVLIHAGFAITVLDEDEAKKTWQLLADLDYFNKTNKRVSG
jgi:hydrogenase expression/formation protein HypC